MAKLVVGENDLGTTNPDLAAQWHPTMNGLVTPQDVTVGSRYMPHWLCDLGHEWGAKIFDRLRGRGAGCPYCSGQRVLAGFNDLATVNPELAAQWHPTKNGTITPQDVTVGGRYKAHWLCDLGHEWEALIFFRLRGRGTGCPYCSGRRILVGFNDLATVNPELAAQWHPTLNGELTPQDVTVSARRMVQWECAEGHDWEAAICDRSKGGGCPYCAGRRVLHGFNDLATTNPELAAQWHPTLNGELTPQEVTAGTQKIVWWKCESLHEWKASIVNRNGRGNGCPYCARKRVLAGFNDLATVNPELASQWHPTLNGKLTAQDVMPMARSKVWWLCAMSHEWEAVIGSRSKGNGCSKCSGVTEQSFRKAFTKFSGLNFDSNLIDLVRSSRKRNKAQIDMLDDDLKLVIEYDGEFAHGENALYRTTLDQKLTDDKETTQALVDIGYNVIRIREHTKKSQLPFVPVGPEYRSTVFQITYKSFGKDKDDIEELVQRIIEEKADWFEMPMKRMLAA